MYNDENNLYHYTYPRDNTQNTTEEAPRRQRVYANIEGEPFRNFDPEIRTMKPSAKKRTGLKIAALALSCALLGGAAGFGGAWIASGRGAALANASGVTETTVTMSDRTADSVAVRTVDGKTAMTEAEVYAANVNSVVSISVTGTSSGTNVFGQAVPFASSGSGFLLTSDGYIVTNYHVIEGGQTVKVTLYNGNTYDATIIGGDEDFDIAVIKIEGSGFQAVTVGDSSLMNVGDHVTAIGNPLGDLTFSMSEGIASSVNRTINVDGTPFNMIQVTCAINPGNSGGPLFNAYGEVVGIVSAKYSGYSTTTVEGLGFAIPINDVLSMVEDIMTNTYVRNKPYLGIRGYSMTADLAAQYQYDVETGIFVASTEEGSCAAKAGLKLGDVIIKVDDQEIKNLEDLNAAKKKYSGGDSATLTIYRDGSTMTVDIVWDSVPEETATPSEQTPESSNPYNGRGNNGQDDYGYGDLFDYFFGNGFGGYGGWGR